MSNNKNSTAPRMIPDNQRRPSVFDDMTGFSRTLVGAGVLLAVGMGAFIVILAVVALAKGSEGVEGMLDFLAATFKFGVLPLVALGAVIGLIKILFDMFADHTHKVMQITADAITRHDAVDAMGDAAKKQADVTSEGMYVRVIEQLIKGNTDIEEAQYRLLQEYMRSMREAENRSAMDTRARLKNDDTGKPRTLLDQVFNRQPMDE
mgnify:CR=1 FL=1